MEAKTHSTSIFIADLAFIYASFLWTHIYCNGFVGMPLTVVVLMVCIALAWFFLHHGLTVAYLDVESGLSAILKNLLTGYFLLSGGVVLGVSVFDGVGPKDDPILWSLLVAFLLSSALRIVFFICVKKLLRSGYRQHSILLVGSGEMAKETLNRILSMRDIGYKLHGILADGDHAMVPEKFFLGGLDIFSKIVGSGRANEVIIALPLCEENVIREMVDQCEREGIRVRIVPDFFRILKNRAVVQSFGDIPLVAIRNEPLNSLRNRVLKRAFDILFSLSVLVLCSPLFIVLAIVVKTTSKGPVCFKQERVGINNKNFHIYKFRTMVEQSRKESDTAWTTENDRRVTAIGGFLRKTNLDELPQFWNVLAGNMSVVGPRPERQYFVEKFKKDIPRYKVRHLVKSGITGLAQVNGWRGDSSIEKRIELDIEYLENWSFWLDLQIIWFTAFGKKVRENAY